MYWWEGESKRTRKKCRVSGIGGKRGIVKALKRFRMGKTGGDGVGVERGRCCFGFRECVGLGAVFEELLAFGFVGAGNGRSKGRGGNIYRDGWTGPRDRTRGGVWLGGRLKVMVRVVVGVSFEVRVGVGVRGKERLKVG
jgi:hypothetical protein